MRFFGLLDFQHLVLAFFLGLLAVIIAAIAWGTYPRRDEGGREHEARAKEIFFGDHSGKPSKPIAPLLVVIYVGVTVWLLGYVLIVGFFGGPIG